MGIDCRVLGLLAFRVDGIWRRGLLFLDVVG